VPLGGSSFSFACWTYQTRRSSFESPNLRTTSSNASFASALKFVQSEHELFDIFSRGCSAPKGEQRAIDAIAPILEGLRSSNASAAWIEFLESYGQVLYQAARTYTSSQDAAADCYVYTCEQLAHNRVKRLLKFNPKGRASVTTWLRVVARNLCFDWHRSQSGRHRPFKSLEGLSTLELETYRWRFAHGASQHETLQQLAPQFPNVDHDELKAGLRTRLVPASTGS
jgi:RNA polymerase sigma factor (sigma-70 family)